MPTKAFSDEEYRKSFIGNNSATSLSDAAFKSALDIRKFEIDLYWKRAAYFWTFIAATLAGFVAIQASSSSNKDDLSVLLCNLGIVFSFGWLCVNRGSKYWQENWEYHVDMLEDAIHGPLYKVVLSRRGPESASEWFIHFLTGPSPISISKINQLISLFVTVMWVLLLVYALPAFNLGHKINWFYLGMTLLAGLACICFLIFGKTYSGGYWHRGSIRTTSINNE